jgi:signal transduction histidine kinase
MDDCDSQLGRASDQRTHFAPAGRVSPETLATQVEQVIQHPVIKVVLESFCGFVLVLNRQRQILAVSPEVREALEARGIHDFLGLRPGEALGCEHAWEGPEGCGTSRACQHCGAVMAILTAHCAHEPVYDECWISIRRKNKLESVEFRAKATPLVFSGTDVVVLALQDISDQKRRGILEQSLLHDARNILSGIMNWCEVLQADSPDDEISVSLRTLVMQLRDLFSEHTLLAQAEKGELKVLSEILDMYSLGRALQGTFSHHPSGEGKNFIVRFPAEAAPPKTDRPLVLRILTNMIANALDASKPGCTVGVAFEWREGKPTFLVHNPGVIPPYIAQRIFQRSFTTKPGQGHGLGTYSMRLYAEQYLGGQVSFETSEEKGTIFQLSLPAT